MIKLKAISDKDNQNKELLMHQLNETLKYLKKKRIRRFKTIPIVNIHVLYFIYL